MGAVKWGQPETSNMGGASGVAREGEDQGWEEWDWVWDQEVRGQARKGEDLGAEAGQ